MTPVLTLICGLVRMVFGSVHFASWDAQSLTDLKPFSKTTKVPWVSEDLYERIQVISLSRSQGDITTLVIYSLRRIYKAEGKASPQNIPEG